MKYSRLLPLIVLALSRPVLQWLLSQFSRYSFCGICRNELEGLALVARGQRSLFLAGKPSTTSFAIIYTGMATLRRGILDCVVHLFDSLLLQRSGLYSGMCIATWNRDASPSSPSLGTFWKATLLHSGLHQRK